MAEANVRISSEVTVFGGHEGNGPSEGKKEEWGQFKDESTDNNSPSDIKFWNIVHKVARVVFTVFLFVVVLSSAVLHKSTAFLLLSNIAPPNTLRNSSLKTSNYHLHYHANETSIVYIWALVLIVVSPYVFTFLSSLWNVIFIKSGSLELEKEEKKNIRKIFRKHLMITMIPEVLHSVGISLLAFGLLPNFDPLAGVTFCLNIVAVPAGMEIIKCGCSSDLRVQISRLLQSIVGAVATLCSMAFWACYIYRKEFDENNERIGLLITVSLMAPLFVSAVWWKNFIPKKYDYLKTIQTQMQDAGAKINSIVSLTKIIITLVVVSLLYGSGCKDRFMCLKVLYWSRTENVPSVNTSVNNSYGSSNEIGRSATLDNLFLGPTTLALEASDVSCPKYFPFYIAIVNILSGLICFRCCIAANQILAKISCFSLPLVLATPVTLIFMIALYTNQTLTLGDPCIVPFPKWEGELEFDWTMIAASILGYTAIVTITGHIWIHNIDRMQSQERMFSVPMYCGLFLDQSMILNRKREESKTERSKGDKDEIDTMCVPEKKKTMLYLCATMWHEKKNEMTQLLKSIFRLDKDQHEQWQNYKCTGNPDYYKFEAHILFDDAFETKNCHRQVNKFVRNLIEMIDKAHGSINGKDKKLGLPFKTDTPYGGRLVWSLPFESKLIVHLKDKEKIRHRKRWSQVMYMYYLLSHKRKDTDSAENTFILALDGDVDFQPAALKLLVDIMKRKSEVGAACGRILPIGAGPMVWYQKFEYAVSHWLQKATEHTLGCVLCSPGCFSLFRGSHLMANGVLKRYTTKPDEARHYVQYDQGEDRWLCTLLLKQGFRVEYCAASDALTYAPEGFYEFYNQRRRWTPSTMANILDLLLDYKNVTEQNNGISMLYIGYQMLLMVSSILTPGTIFLMIIGAINMAYPSLSLFWALTLNLIPVAIFILSCFLAKPSTQLAYAAVLSTVYSLVMMLVIVGLIKQAADNGFCSVTTVFLCFVVGVFVIAAFIHPQEFWCILHGFLYFLAIPSMSMLLILYAIGNLHVVSWGTRETANPSSDQNPSASQKRENTVKEWLGDVGFARDSEYMFSFGNLFRCICCPDDKRNDRDVKIEALQARVNFLESSLGNEDTGQVHDNQVRESIEQTTSPLQKDISSRALEKDFKDDTLAHTFAHDKSIKGIIQKLDENEKGFWEQLIKSYLFPLNEDKEHQRSTQSSLTELRNKVCLFFILTNALFVTIVFSLQQVNLESGGSVSKELPCANGNHGGSFEPISMAFTGVFGVLLFIQFLCMLLHRMSTFLQICSITEIGKKHQPEDDKENKAQDYTKLLKKTKTTIGEPVNHSDDEATNVKRPYLGPREQFKRTLREVKTLGQECIGKPDQYVKEKAQEVFPDLDEQDITTMVALVKDQGFHKTLRRRDEQIAMQRTMMARTVPGASAAPHHSFLSQYSRGNIQVDRIPKA